MREQQETIPLKVIFHQYLIWQERWEDVINSSLTLVEFIKLRLHELFAIRSKMPISLSVKVACTVLVQLSVPR